MEQQSKQIQETHLRRRAVIYVRCSVLRFASASPSLLLARARALGWEDKDISLIDQDSGRPGLSLAECHGYAALVADVQAGGVGAVFVADLSRLGRLASEMDAFTKVCARTDTLILTECEIFDPKITGDRVLVGLSALVKDSEILRRRR